MGGMRDKYPRKLGFPKLEGRDHVVDLAACRNIK
jgi:hypothetical protein